MQAFRGVFLLVTYSLQAVVQQKFKNQALLAGTRAVQSAGLAGQKPGEPGFLLPDRFEPTGPAKAGPAKKSRPGKKKAAPANGKPARRKKAGPVKKSRAGKKKPGRQKKAGPAQKIPARQIRAGRVWKRAALLVPTSQWANIARSAFRSFKCA